MRVAEMASTNSTASQGLPKRADLGGARSTSKPSTWFVAGFKYPKMRHHISRPLSAYELSMVARCRDGCRGGGGSPPWYQEIQPSPR